jgi:hypothetical protein
MASEKGSGTKRKIDEVTDVKDEGTGGGNNDSITLYEYLTKEESLQEEALQQMMAKNWGNEKECTYAKGYITQPVYSCVTCSVANNETVCFFFTQSSFCRL